VLGRGKLARRGPGFALAGPEFTAVAPPGLDRVGEIYDVAVGPDGSVALVGTTGVARLNGDRVEAIDLGPLPGSELPGAEQGWAVAFDGGGALWVARTYGITRVGADGRPHTLVLPPEKQVGSGWGWLPSMMVDRSGNVWLLTVVRPDAPAYVLSKLDPHSLRVLGQRSLGRTMLRSMLAVRTST